MAAALGSLNTTIRITSILQFGLPGSGLQLKRRIGRRNGRFCSSRQYGKAFVRRSGLKALTVGGRRQSGRHSLSPNTRKLKLHSGINGKGNRNLKCNELSLPRKARSPACHRPGDYHIGMRMCAPGQLDQSTRAADWALYISQEYHFAHFNRKLRISNRSKWRLFWSLPLSSSVFTRSMLPMIRKQNASRAFITDLDCRLVWEMPLHGLLQANLNVSEPHESIAYDGTDSIKSNRMT